MRTFSFIITFILLSVSIPWADDIKSVRDLSDGLKNPRKGRLSSADITLLDFKIGRETLDDIRSRLGNADLFRRPPNSVSANNELCYASSDPADKTIVIFGSGPMGGWSKITTFQVLSSESHELPCSPASKVSRNVSTQSGIRLGMPVTELIKKFGKPSDQGQWFITFTFKENSEHPKRKDFNVLSGVMAAIAGGRITSFKVFLIESN